MTTTSGNGSAVSLQRTGPVSVGRAWVTRIVTLVVVIALGLGVMPKGLSAQASDAADAPMADAGLSPQAAAAPAWMEPQGLNVIDLVGLVPEEHLRGAILAFAPVNGILQYIEGQRFADRVVMRVKVWPRFEPTYHTYFNCPSLRAFSDHWLVAMPAGTIRLFQGDVDITDRIMRLNYFPAGLIQPVRPAIGERYQDVRNARIELDATGAMRLPANQGCTMVMDGIYDQGDLTATFTLYTPQVISVTDLGSDTFSFGVYRGTGYAGLLESLRSQLQKRFGNRHDKFALSIPSGTDYVLLNYPTSPVSPYIVGDISRNIVTPSSGTYRLAVGTGSLSVDHQITMGLPLHAQYQDRDQKDGRFLNRLAPINTLAALEYFVPEGIGYHGCMQYGGCPDELLSRIAGAQMEMSLHYYRIEPISDQLITIPLQQVGSSYRGAVVTSEDEWVGLQTSVGLLGSHDRADGTSAVQLSPLVHLPMLGNGSPAATPLSAQQQCPCGLFTPDGRMVDVIP